MPPFNSIWFQLLIGCILGATFGSFFTMLAYRLPRHLSIVQPGSHCPSCKARLGFKDLVPIFSWLTSFGRCRHCAASIGVRYLWIEIASTAVGGLALVLIVRGAQ